MHYPLPRGQQKSVGNAGVQQLYLVNADQIGSSVTERMLASARITTHVFDSPLQLLRRLPLPAPACLLIDFLLPDMNGLQLLERLRRSDCLHPVIIASTRNEPEWVIAAMNRGAFGVLKRPYQALELIDMVQRAFNQDQAIYPYIAEAMAYRRRREQLSRRESDILSFLELGLTARAIGEKLGLSFRTVENHRGRIFAKLNIATGVQLVRCVTILNVLRAQGTLD